MRLLGGLLLAVALLVLAPFAVGSLMDSMFWYLAVIAGGALALVLTIERFQRWRVQRREGRE